MNAPDERLQRLLGGDGLRWLRDRVRLRLERGQPVTGTVSRSPATAAERDAVARLLGRRPRDGSGVSVRLEDIDVVLRTSGAHPDGLAAAVVALTGPVRARTDTGAAWAAAFAPLDTVVDALADWADGLRASGAVRRITHDPAQAHALLTRLAAALAALPTEPEPIGRFAERVLGSAHALDTDQPLSGLVFGAARVLGGTAEGDGAAWRRSVWAAVGLLRDELSSTVLVLNLPVVPGSPIARLAGEPLVLTLRQLRRPVRLRGPVTVSVCENPVVVAEAADRLGPDAGPLVCVNGQPGVATMYLLQQLVESGARLRYHGDFDWGGLRIGNVLFGRLPMSPWRFDTAAYRLAAADGAGRALTGRPTAASWDPALAEAMRELGRAVEEERLVDDLLADLATS